ncbi:hypothetical protein Acr_15g0002310 [Actinidia rufa]|uniref:Uncharacterized protein n=1 Tax=Actinidia rufa TaxID=165716 RepID=A0A7J0FSD5_9ERIC|nr:hypothetical protein Acr_15g0002310 [Actinidia rufa]
MVVYGFTDEDVESHDNGQMIPKIARNATSSIRDEEVEARFSKFCEEKNLFPETGASNQQSILLGLLGTGPRDSGGDGESQVFYLAQGRGGDSTLALGELMSTPMVALASSVGDDLAKFHGLVLPRSRGFGDECSAMSKRLKLSDLAKVVAQKAATSALKGVVISEGSETTSGKRALDDGSKGKQVAQSPEPKKARIETGASGAPARPPVASGAEKIMAGVILPADKEKVDRLTFDQVVTKFLHALGQGVILGSSLAVRSRDFAECAFNQKVVAESAEMEMVRAQNRAIELEGALSEEKAKGKKLTEDADARSKVIAKLEARISELEKSQSLTQGRIIAAFKESDDFLEAVRGSASSYFGDGFDFCKRQLAHQYPDLGVDLEDVEMDHEFLAKEEAKAEQRAAEEGAAGAEGVGCPVLCSPRPTSEAKNLSNPAFLDIRSPRGEVLYRRNEPVSVVSTKLPKDGYLEFTKEGNAMSQAELDKLGSTYSFPSGIRFGFLGMARNFVSSPRRGSFTKPLFWRLKASLSSDHRKFFRLQDLPAQLSPNAWLSHLFAGDLESLQASHSASLEESAPRISSNVKGEDEVLLPRGRMEFPSDDTNASTRVQILGMPGLSLEMSPRQGREARGDDATSHKECYSEKRTRKAPRNRNRRAGLSRKRSAPPRRLKIQVHRGADQRKGVMLRRDLSPGANMGSESMSDASVVEVAHRVVVSLFLPPQPGASAHMTSNGSRGFRRSLNYKAQNELSRRRIGWPSYRRIKPAPGGWIEATVIDSAAHTSVICSARGSSFINSQPRVDVLICDGPSFAEEEEARKENPVQSCPDSDFLPLGDLIGIPMLGWLKIPEPRGGLVLAHIGALNPILMAYSPVHTDGARMMSPARKPAVRKTSTNNIQWRRFDNKQRPGFRTSVYSWNSVAHDHFIVPTCPVVENRLVVYCAYRGEADKIEISSAWTSKGGTEILFQLLKTHFQILTPLKVYSFSDEEREHLPQFGNESVQRATAQSCCTFDTFDSLRLGLASGANFSVSCDWSTQLVKLMYATSVERIALHRRTRQNLFKEIFKRYDSLYPPSSRCRLDPLDVKIAMTAETTRASREVSARLQIIIVEGDGVGQKRMDEERL